MAAMATSKEVIVVTGCSTGLGRGVVLALAKRPGTLVIATARKLADIMDLKESGNADYCLECDVCSDESVKACMEKAASLGGGHIDGLVANAGLSSFGPMALQPIDDIHKVMNTNVYGVIRCVQAAVPYMAKPKCRGGRIAIVGSISASLTTPFAGAYCASKSAVQTMGEAMRMELAPFGIKVTNIHAACITSNFSKNGASNSSLDVFKDSIYTPLMASIEKRIHMSQTHPSSMPADQVGEQVVRKAFGPGPAPAAIAVAGGVHKLLCFGFVQKWLPSCLMDIYLAKGYGLNITV